MRWLVLFAAIASGQSQAAASALVGSDAASELAGKASSTVQPRMGGAIPEDEVEFRTLPLASSGETGALPPAHWDWRNVGGSSYLSPVTAQGSCGSCVSFAIVAALEATLNIACDDPGRSFQLSRQFHFSCGGGACATGLKVSDGMAFLGTTGAPDDACLHYGATDGHDVACSLACSDWSSRTVRGVSFTTPTIGFVDITAVKQALLKAPLVSNMILFADFDAYTGGVYRHATGNQIGSHAIVLVGWDDQDKAWIARNSMGPDWGDHGYFEIAWNDASLPGRYTWLIDVSKSKQDGMCLFPR